MVAGIVPMDLKKKVTISWSGGKDSAFALYKILLSGQYEVTGLHTIMNEDTKRVGMHGVREELMDNQAGQMGLPLTKLYLENSENDAAYQKLMKDYYQQCADERIDAVVFGDIFLEDLMRFRLELLKPSGLTGTFPLWMLDTRLLMDDFLKVGFKTLLCAGNAKFFDDTDVGRTIDQKFVDALKPGVDPCGENGEFHTFVYDGPIFKEPVHWLKGEVVKKAYRYKRVNERGESEIIDNAFWFQDLLPMK